MSSNVKRKSAAVMFTDIAGYTNLMARDEEKALSLLQNKRTIIKPLIQEYDGIYVKGTGDGTLSYFDSAYKASKCAKTFQENIYDDGDMNVRVGIHIGDIVFEDEDVYGDGVNIAARLENLAPVGGICVSNTVYDELRNKKEFEGVKLGLQSLKGVGRLIEVFGLKGKKLKEPNPQDYKENEVEVYNDNKVPSIAVIPFDNKGADEDIFFAYGVSADLSSAIAGAGCIRVAASKEIEELEDMSFQDKVKKLLVRYVVSGSLWKVGDIFQLSVELYDVKKSQVLWSDHWEESWKNLPLIKEQLSKSLLAILNQKSQSKTIKVTNKAEAYEYYLNAKYKIEKLGCVQKAKDKKIVMDLLNKAIEMDEYLFEAKALLISMYQTGGEILKAKSGSDELMKIAKELNNKKYQASALCTKAMCYMVPKFNSDKQVDDKFWEITLDYIKEATDLANEINDFEQLGECLFVKSIIVGLKGAFQEAIDAAFELIDLNKKLEDKKGLGQAYFTLGQAYFVSGDYLKAEKTWLKLSTIAEKEEFFTMQVGASTFLSDLYIIYKQDLDRALTLSEKIIKLCGENYPLYIAMAYAKIGHILIEKKEYKTALKNLFKSEKIYARTEITRRNIHTEVLIAFAEKKLGQEDSNTLNKLKKHISESNKITKVLSRGFDTIYFAYQVFGKEKGKEYLKHSIDKIEKIKLHLKGESLKTFLDSHYVRWILKEWNQINN